MEAAILLYKAGTINTDDLALGKRCLQPPQRDLIGRIIVGRYENGVIDD
jgi:hypothetical protein